MKNVNLQAARESTGMTQKEVATEVHISEQAYQRYELGLGKPKAFVAIAIADALGIKTLEEFKAIFGAATPEGRNAKGMEYKHLKL